MRVCAVQVCVRVQVRVIAIGGKTVCEFVVDIKRETSTGGWEILVPNAKKFKIFNSIVLGPS